MKTKYMLAALSLAGSVAVLLGGCSGVKKDPSVYIISKDVAAQSGFWETDMIRLCTALQGIINRDFDKTGAALYQDHDESDRFWLEYMRGEGKILENHALVEISTPEKFWEEFLPGIKKQGIILWDPEVPATSNVASTVCGVSGWLPVKSDASPESLHSFLTGNGVPVKFSLVGMFTGKGKIPDTDLDSTGSAKNDAYIWAMEKYMDKTSKTHIAYTLDGAGTLPGNPIYDTAEGTDGRYNAIYSHDYYISKGMFFFDLTPVDTEPPCDDPGQPPGTDRATLLEIFSRTYRRSGGEFVQLMGFPPWWMKYTTFLDHGSVEPVTLEWQFTELISAYNLVKEADAAHPAWMTNASLYTWYPLEDSYANNRPGSFPEDDGETFYFTIYMGDYDSSAWLKTHVAKFWSDPERGALPLMWGFNPNLSDRVPMVWDYLMKSLTPNDYIFSGDSGAGYVFPSALIDPALRNLPPAGELWVEYNRPYFERFDLDAVGFIINGTNPVTDEVMDMYNRIAPAGSFHNDPARPLTVYNGTPYIYLQNYIDPNGEGVADTMYYHMLNLRRTTRFTAFRTICQSPSDVFKCVENFLAYAKERSPDRRFVYADPYTLLELAKNSGMGEVIK